MANEAYYTTVRKESFRRMDDVGDVKSYWRIYAKSKGGTLFNIEIPDVEILQAPAALLAKAKQIDSI
jgi:hypothetical protein